MVFPRVPNLEPSPSQSPDDPDRAQRRPDVSSPARMKDTKMTLIADTRLVTRVAMGMGMALCIMIALSLYGINQVNGIS